MVLWSVPIGWSRDRLMYCENNSDGSRSWHSHLHQAHTVFRHTWDFPFHALPQRTDSFPGRFVHWYVLLMQSVCLFPVMTIKKFWQTDWQYKDISLNQQLPGPKRRSVFRFCLCFPDSQDYFSIQRTWTVRRTMPVSIRHEFKKRMIWALLRSPGYSCFSLRDCLREYRSAKDP